MSHQNLSEITKTLSELVNRPVGVYNDFFDLISFTSDSVKKISDVLAKEELVGEKNLVHKPVVIEEAIYHVYFFPIHIKADTSGTLIVIADVAGSGKALDSLDMFAIEQATTVFALELQSLYQQLSNQFIHEGRMMEQLLEGPGDGEHILQKNGSNVKHAQYVVLTLEIVEEEDSKTQQKKQSFSRLLQRLLDQSAMKTLVYEKAQHYSILFILEESLSVEVVQQKISEFVGKLRERTPFNILAGLGREFSNLEEIHSSLKDSQMCIKFLKQTGGHNRAVLTNQDLGVHRLFLDMEKQELENYWKMKLRSVHEYDQVNGTELLPTLEWYLFFSQNVRKTAEVMYVHENTIKYRINSVRKVMEIDELTGDVLLEIYLALKIYNYLGEPRLSK